MTQADRIRRYVLAHHIAPARAAGSAEVSVCAGTVSRAMNLRGRIPNICSVLGSVKFLDMAKLRLLDRLGPVQSTTTTFRYALAAPARDAASAPTAPTEPAARTPRDNRAVTIPPQRRRETAKLSVVIACAGTKAASRGHMTLSDGQCVRFVANPREAPTGTSLAYRHPDEAAPSGLSWRQMLVEYNRHPAENPLSLLPAWRLYEPFACPRIYLDLVEAYGLENVFILSAGWGLVTAGFLLPDYDITFASGAEAYKRRRARDHYEDFAMRPVDAARPIVFLGGRSYIRSFCELTEGVAPRRIVFHHSRRPPRAENCELRSYKGASPRTWHYHCARALIRGDIRV